MGYFDKPASQALLAIFPMYDEETRLFLGQLLSLVGSEQYRQLVDSGYSWRRFGDVDHGNGEWAKYRNYVQEAQYHQLKTHESPEAAQAYHDAR